MRPNVHLLGIQGSGKGTQSALLLERFTATYLASGNLFRERAAIDDAFGRHLNTLMSDGHLLPDSLLIATVDHFLRSLPSHDLLIGDGIIRTLSQEQHLEPIWTCYGIEQPYLIYLELDEETALQRIKQRVEEATDPSKRSYHERFSGKLVKRADDNAQALEERFRLFYKNTEPIVEYFTHSKRCFKVDAHLSAADVSTKIIDHLTSLYPDLQ